MSLLGNEGTLKGKTVAVLAADDNEGPHQVDGRTRAEDAWTSSAGRTAMLTISGTDTTAAQAQLDSFIEKWKSENVDSLIILGETDVREAVRARRSRARCPTCSSSPTPPRCSDKAQDLRARATSRQPVRRHHHRRGRDRRRAQQGRELQALQRDLQEAHRQGRARAERGRQGAQRQAQRHLRRGERRVRGGHDVRSTSRPRPVRR